MTHPCETTLRYVSPIECMTRRCLEVQTLRICKGSPGGPEYLNSLVFELTLNYFQYQTPSISKVTNEKKTRNIVILLSLENMNSSVS